MNAINSALEIANELREERDRLHALCTVIIEKVGYQKSEDGGMLDPVDFTAYRIAEVLEESLADFNQLSRLIGHLEKAAI